jgi:predicted porin
VNLSKKLTSLAVAAAMAAPVAALADATIYGKLNNSIDYVDVDANSQFYGPGATPSSGVPAASAVLTPDAVQVLSVDANGNPTATGAVPNTGAHGFKGWDLNANQRSNRVGIKGSEDLGGGLKAIYQVEFGVRLTDADGRIVDGDPGTVSMRNSFVGLAGGYGTFLVGRHDTPFKISTGKLDLFSDTLADYNHTVGFQDLRADNAVAYISPSFSGFQFAGAIIPSGGATALGYGGSLALTAADGTPLGDNGEAPDNIAEAYSLAGIYKNGPFYAGIGYENLGSAYWSSTLDTVDSYADRDGVFRSNYLGIPNYGGAEDWTKWRLGLGLLDWNGFTLTGIYESHSNVAGAPEDADMQLWQVQAGYSFGNNTIKGMYGQSSTDNCVMGGSAVNGGSQAYAATCNAAVTAWTGYQATAVDYLDNQDHSTWAIAFDHNFSKRTRAYALYTAVDSDVPDSNWSGFSLGMIHDF